MSPAQGPWSSSGVLVLCTQVWSEHENREETSAADVVLCTQVWSEHD